MNRHYIIASHAHFAKGLYESVKLLVGEHADVDILNAFVDGNDDIEKEALALVDACSDNVDVVVLTLFLSNETEDTADLLRQLVADNDVRPKFVNDVSIVEEDETF